MEESEKYLQEGEVTQITPLVRKVAAKILGEGRKFIQNLFKWIRTGNYFQKLKEKEERKLLDTQHLQRTADQILKSRYAIACGEKTAVFIPLCRAKGIPVKYVEAVALDWLKQKTDENMHSHAFAEAYLNNSWTLIDPERMEIYPEINYEKLGYIKWAEGIDFRNLTDTKGRRYAWHHLKDLKKDTLSFKRRWKKESQPSVFT